MTPLPLPALPAFAGLRPFFDNHLMRLEDETKTASTRCVPSCPESSRPRTSRSPSSTSADDQGHADTKGRVARDLGVLVRIIHTNGALACRRRRGRHQRHLRQGASSPFQSRCPTRRRLRSTSRCSRSLPSTRTTRTTRTRTTITTRTRRFTRQKARISTDPTKGPDPLPSKAWKPQNSSPCWRGAGWRCSPVRGCPPIRESPTTADPTRRRAIR